MDKMLMSKLVGRLYIHSTLLEMIKKADEIGVKRGVAVVMVTEKLGAFGEVGSLSVNGKFERRSRGAGDPGTNYFGIAMAKLGVMMSTLMDSGTFKNSLKRGEVPYRGGLYKKVGIYHVFIAFSGGTEDQDVEIAQAGVDYHLKGVEKLLSR